MLSRLGVCGATATPRITSCAASTNQVTHGLTSRPSTSTCTAASTWSPSHATFGERRRALQEHIELAAFALTAAQPRQLPCRQIPLDRALHRPQIRCRRTTVLGLGDQLPMHRCRVAPPIGQPHPEAGHRYETDDAAPEPISHGVPPATATPSARRHPESARSIGRDRWTTHRTYRVVPTGPSQLAAGPACSWRPRQQPPAIPGPHPNTVSPSTTSSENSITYRSVRRPDLLTFSCRPPTDTFVSSHTTGAPPRRVCAKD